MGATPILVLTRGEGEEGYPCPGPGWRGDTIGPGTRDQGYPLPVNRQTDNITFVSGR